MSRRRFAILLTVAAAAAGALQTARGRRAFVRLVSLLPYRVLDALGTRTTTYSLPWFVLAAAWATKDWRTGR